MQHIIKEEIINRVVRKTAGKVYYFDSEGVYRCIPEKQAKENGVTLHYFWRNPYNMKNMICGIHNLTLVSKAIARVKVGETLEDFDRYLSSMKLERHQKPEGVERFVTKVCKPTFSRVPENLDAKTFDYVLVEVNVVQRWEEDRISYIQKNKKQIQQMVLSRLENSKDFQSYGVPINFLKLTRMTLRRDSVLEFLFELKELH